MKEQTKGDTMKFQYVIHTQNLEEYGENFHKFKGGSTYVVGATKDDSEFLVCLRHLSEATVITLNHETCKQIQWS